MSVLDMTFRGRYIAGLFSTALMLLGQAASAAPSPTRGAILPPGSQQVGESRFKSSQNYADTLIFFGKTYKSNPRKSIVNQPGLRGIHIVNQGKGDWDGLNVYELDGETRIFVVTRDPAPKGK